MAQALKKTSYHHGNLKEALVETALEMLKTLKPDDLSLRKLAGQLGVSQTAVYSHFKDKTALIAAIAAHGFHDQARYMTDRIRDIKDPYLRLEEIAVAYMQFAFDNRALFQVMFSRDVQDLPEHAELSLNAGKPYSLFAAAWSRYRPDHAHQMPFIWSMIHGQTVLMCDPKFGPAMSRGLSPKDLAQKSIQVFKG